MNQERDIQSETLIRDEIARFGQSLFQRGLTSGSSGNISVRTLDGGWLMTPTNACLGLIDPARISRLDPGGKLLDGDPPTKESFLHMAVYSERPQAQAVIHLHCTHAVAVSCLAEPGQQDCIPPLTPYYVMRIGKLAVVPYYPPGDQSLENAIRTAAKEHSAILLANHGPVVAGKSLSAAVYAIEELEETAKLYLMLRNLNPRYLTEDQVTELEMRFPK